MFDGAEDGLMPLLPTTTGGGGSPPKVFTVVVLSDAPKKDVAFAAASLFTSPCHTVGIDAPLEGCVVDTDCTTSCGVFSAGASNLAATSSLYGVVSVCSAGRESLPVACCCCIIAEVALLSAGGGEENTSTVVLAVSAVLSFDVGKKSFFSSAWGVANIDAASGIAPIIVVAFPSELFAIAP